MEPTPGPSRSARRISAEEASQRILQWIEADGSDCTSKSDGDSFHSNSSDSHTDNDDRSRSRTKTSRMKFFTFWAEKKETTRFLKNCLKKNLLNKITRFLV